MFIEEEQSRSAPFEGAECCGNGEALLEFRSSEPSWYGFLAGAYKHLTPSGVKTAGHSQLSRI